MTTELALIDESALSVSREPEAVLEEAHRAAAALKRVIDAKPHKVMFGGVQYLEFEDWQTVGRFYGIAPKITATRPLTMGEFSGWEASADAIHVPTGRVIASADAMCMNDEEKWRARPKYEYHYATKSQGLQADPLKHEMIWEKGADGKSRPKKERILVGEESVPMFQLRSMAQTRAGAKALRNALAWVVVLAGYRPTPAEEMDVSRQVVATVVDDHEDEPPAREVTPPRDEQREFLMGRIKTLGERFSREQRKAMWEEVMGPGVVPSAAPLEALHALHDKLAALRRVSVDAFTAGATVTGEDFAEHAEPPANVPAAAASELVDVPLDESTTLLLQISLLRQRLKLGEKAFAALAREHAGTANVSEADPAALAALLEAMRKFGAK